MSVDARIRLRRARTRLHHALGETRRRLAGAHPGPRAVLLVLGCQRSGTTLMTDLLARDPEAKVYPEHSAISARDHHGLRLAPLPTVAAHLSRSRFPLVVLKPLVESQNAPALLDVLPRARALWMFRHYADVARSNLARFGEGNGIKNLRSIALGTADWRGEGASEEVMRRVREHFAEDMNPWDAAALFWWARNALFFEAGLDARDDVRLCRYEDLVAAPLETLRHVYAFTGGTLPEAVNAEGVSGASVGRGRDVPLSAEVVALCEKRLAQLEASHAAAANLDPAQASACG